MSTTNERAGAIDALLVGPLRQFMTQFAAPDSLQHPATGGGPIFRTSPKGQPWEGLCGPHLSADIADSSPVDRMP